MFLTYNKIYLAKKVKKEGYRKEAGLKGIALPPSPESEERRITEGCKAEIEEVYGRIQD